MKKFIIVFIVLFSFIGNVYAKEQVKPNLTFVYINGSNNNNEKMKEWYINGINRTHPVLKKRFEKNSYIKKWNKDNHLVINPIPKIFFWGYDSKEDLNFVLEKLDISKAMSSYWAFKVRNTLTEIFHDALWIQKEHHMNSVLDNLNNVVIDLSKKDQNVVLFGYSAGTFVTYQYLVYKLPYINLSELFTNLKADKDVLTFVKENPRQDTCLSAISHTGGDLGIIANNGDFVLYQDKEHLKKQYLAIDKATEKYCAPKGRVKGVVNYASSLPLFYSDIGDKEYKMNYFSDKMTKYVLENGIYFLTINFREDPLGIPSGKNFTIPQYEQRMDVKLENPTGVIYDNSKVWSRKTVFTAHTSYWKSNRAFSKGVVKSFVDGRRFMYDEKYQAKVLKRKIRKDPEIDYGK